MSAADRYYVRREECWGGTFVWSVVDRQWRGTHDALRAKRRVFKTEKAAIRRCAKMNQDWERFHFATGARA
jgi:hypothetical protein